MQIDYDVKAKQFVIAGRKVSRREVRAQINGLLDYVEKQSSLLAKRFSGGDITIAEFEIEMRGLLQSAHIISASVGKGGRALMTQADWGRVGAKIKWQYGYLQKFAKKLERGVLSEAAAANRARSYASAIYISFAQTFEKAQKEFVEGGKNPLQVKLEQNSKEGCSECSADAAEGFVSVDDFTEIGGRICGDYCLCDAVFSDDQNAEDIKFNVKVTVE